MSPKYYLDLFTGKTWEEFLAHGANESGFNDHHKKAASRIHSGDHLICYLTRISRFIGLLKVTSDWRFDESKVWEDKVFPVRFNVNLEYKLTASTAVPVQLLRDKLTIFKNLKDEKNWSGFFRGSLAEFDAKDADVIVQSIKEAVAHPIEREFDRKKYWYASGDYESTNLGSVTIPEDTDEEVPAKSLVSHEEIQWLLLKLGSTMGLDVWVASNDRNKEFNGETFNKLPHVINNIPRQFDDATNKTIEMIDVLWLEGDSFEAAFEIEHTSSIYSGLLRMSDLRNLQPNLNIKLYIVAPDDRRDKVIKEIRRPTFNKLKPPLHAICKFIPYSKLKKEYEQIGHRAQYLRPDFIDEIAESCEED